MNPENLRPPWQKGQSGNPKGRPKNRVKETLVEALKLTKKKELRADLSPDEVKDYERYLIGASSDDLTVLAQDASIPIYVRALARAIIIELKNGKTSTIDRLRDRIVGKETQKIEITGKDGEDLIPARRLSQEEAKQLMKELDDKC